MKRRIGIYATQLTAVAASALMLFGCAAGIDTSDDPDESTAVVDPLACDSSDDCAGDTRCVKYVGTRAVCMPVNRSAQPELQSGPGDRPPPPPWVLAGPSAHVPHASSAPRHVNRVGDADKRSHR